MNNPINRHPDMAKLMSYSAGSLPEPLAATVAAHVSMCAECRDDARDMELMGAALMCTSPGDHPARKGSAPPRTSEASMRYAPASAMDADGERLPAPIARHYGLAFASIPWKRLGPGVWHHRLALSPGVTGDLRLLKISAGRKMPVHGHGGSEITLVLEGAYADASGEYRRGDIQDLDEEIEHQPMADKDTGCICLIASEKPARFKGVIGRLMQPWTGM